MWHFFNFFVETVMGGTWVLDIPHWGQIVKDVFKIMYLKARSDTQLQFCK